MAHDDDNRDHADVRSPPDDDYSGYGLSKLRTILKGFASRTWPTMYGPLSDFLRDCRAEEALLTFRDIERMTGHDLPKSARSGPWWANQVRHYGRQCGAWMDVGWRVERVDFPGERVTFRRAN